jgi:pimeloyl-ACP methyl ester carboxylesterase
VLRDPAQRSAFLADFLGNQLPRRAEKTLTRDDGAFVARMFIERSTSAWQQTPEFVEAVRRNRSAIQIPGAAHCSLEYRRWAFRSQFRRDGATFMHLMNRRLSIPVLALRGDDDKYIGADAVAAARYYASRLTYTEVPDAAHFAHQENPARTSELLVEHLDTVGR